jgi:hypothetical protein
MVNIEQITSTLAKLPDQALQRYAMMHKDDPYIMSLAVSESKRRKELRSAGQGAQGMQEQPKVVDQEIDRMGDMQNASPEQLARLSQLLEARKQAEYKEFTGGGREQPIPQQQQQLPEAQGIGLLPAGDMNFADGGITGYAGGGLAEKYRLESEEMGSGTRMQYSPDVQNYARQMYAAEQASQKAFADQERARMSQLPYGNTGAPGAAPVRQVAAPVATMPAPGYTRGDPRALPSMPSAADQLAAASAPAETGAAPDAARGLSGATEKPPARDQQKAGIASIAPTAQGDMVTRARELANSLYDTREQDLALGALQNQTTQRMAELRETLAKRPKTKAMEGLEKNLKEEAAGEAGEKDQAKGMAIFKAGLALMSGESPNAFVNFGKAGLLAANEYGGAIKEIKKASKDRQKLFAEIEEKRRLQEIGDWDAAAATDQKIADLQGKVQEKVLSFAEKTTGVKATMAGSLVSRELDEQAQNRRSAQSFANQLKLRDMPTYEQGQQKEYVKQWLAKPENKGKTEIDAVVALGLLGNTPRAATPTDMRMAASAILADPTGYSDEEVAAARRTITGIIGPQAAGAPAAPPSSAIAALRANKSLAAQFDAKYGQGSSAQYLK